MKKSIKRMLSMALVLVMMLTLLPAAALAQEYTVPRLPSVMQTAQTEIHPNPLYEGLVDESLVQLPQIAGSQIGTAAVDASDYVTEAGAAEQLREAMVNRQSSCVVNVATTNSNHNDLMESLFHQALVHTGNPVEGDYLAWQYGSWRAGSSYYVDGSTYYYTSTFTFTYYTDAAQEALMDTEVDKLLAELDLEEASDYNKVKGIYDYICANVTYDYDNLYDSTYLLKHSAYAALINKTAVCQGYAILVYRLALELGVDCRLIAGQGGGEPHGWNIVKLGNLYYNLDSTWDAGQSSYSYFLVSDANFGGHTRGNYESSNGIDYTGDSFCAAYPVSPENYVLVPEDGEIITGVCGDNLVWEYSEATGGMTISGTGDMYDFTSSGQPWESYTQEITAVTLTEGVTSVGDYAFFHCYGLAEVKLPDSVTSIGSSAFFYCSALESVELPDDLVTIEDHAFGSCGKLTGMEFPAGLLSIGKTAFSGTALTGAVLPGGLTTIGEQAFMGCPLTEVSLPSTLTSLGFGAFQDCAFLAGIAVHVDNSVYCSDRQGAVYSKDMTTLIVVPAGYSGTFVIPDTVTALEAGALRNCDLLTGVQIPDSVVSIGRMAFYDSDSLQNVVLPGSVTEIPRSGFSWCDSLSSIILPERLTSIEQSAFLECPSLKRIVLPAGVKTLEARAFSDSGLETVIFRGDAPEFADTAVFSGVTVSAYYPGSNETWTEDVMQDYGGTITWIASVEYTILPDSVTDIEDTASETVTIHTDGALSHFVAVYVDGKAVDEENYTLTEGSTVVTFHADFLDTLSVGSHSLILEFTDGFATGTIRIDAGHVHDYDYHTELTLPTCTEQGCTVYTCLCGDSYVGSYTAPLGHSYENGSCTRCGAVDPDYEAPVTGPEGVTRIAGAGRVETSLGIANTLKEQLGVEKFSNVVVASALNFPDALAGSYLAARMNAPILLTYAGQQADVMAYIHGNLQSGGTVYILGGESAVSANFADMLSASGIRCERVAGNDRFGTNLAILNRAGVSAGQPILVCTAFGFADSLSVSATGLPILLVGQTLSAAQKEFLNSCGGGKFWIVGGYGAVSASVENELKQYASEIERLAGAGRHETSVLVADKFLPEAKSTVVAYSMNFPDGLCGGPLAYSLGAPLILTNSADTCINEYTNSRNITDGYVLGGNSLVNDVAVRRIFHMGAGDAITLK